MAVDWKGMQDGTPPSDPKAPLDSPRTESPGDWKGLQDGTPPSSPGDPNRA